jgi:hypothetical protein
MVTARKLHLPAVLQEYPIAHELGGWFFRLDALPKSRWRARGTDLWGRTVVCEGSSPDVLFECVSRAKRVPPQA